jgi:hypothetical protein
VYFASSLSARTLLPAWQTLNTNFPNYDVSARLVHEGYDTSRMYQYSWIQREKDRRDLDDRTIGIVPFR